MPITATADSGEEQRIADVNGVGVSSRLEFDAVGSGERLRADRGTEPAIPGLGNIRGNSRFLRGTEKRGKWRTWYGCSFVR